MTDPKTIARGLSERERRALFAISAITLEFAEDERAARDLYNLGCTMFTGGAILPRKYQLTPFGVEVRRECQRILQETPQ